MAVEMVRSYEQNGSFEGSNRRSIGNPERSRRMFQRMIAFGVVGLAPLLGIGCTGQSGTPPASSRAAGLTADGRSQEPATPAGAEKDIKPNQVVLAVTGMS
jgi:hypothetical protein